MARQTRRSGRARRSLRAVVPVVLLGMMLLGSSPAAAVDAGTVRVQAAPAIPSGARATGSVSATATVTGAVVLAPRDSAGLQRFIAQVTDAASPQFGHYLAPGQFAGRFGPAPATVAAVRSSLAADGLTVGATAGDGLVIGFSGSASRVQSAFGTTLDRYRLADGSTGRAPATALTLPASIAGAVTAVVGLDDLVGERPMGVLHGESVATGHFTAARSAAFSHPAGAPAACSDARAAAQADGGLTDDQIANAYGAFGLYGAGDLGAGQHIAIYENEPFLRSDIQTFDTCFFGASASAAMMKRLTVIPVDGGQPIGPGSGEASLDVEDISAMAPGASIDVYEGPYTGVNANIYDSLDEYTAIVDADRDQVVSTSWGLCEQAIQQGQPGLQQAENLLFEQAAAQGQSIFSAAGDNGSDDCNTNETPTPVAGQNPVSVDDPSSQPDVVAVGGTAIDDAGSQPAVEQVWNDGPDGGAGGGGISDSWPMPAWQQAARVPGVALPGGADFTNADSVERAFGYAPGFCQSAAPGAGPDTPCRLLPDVSSQADEFTGSVTVYSAEYAGTPFSANGWTTTGGTSSAAPIWAAMLADVNASPACAANPATARGVGFVSPLLYAVASDPVRDAASFNDITQGGNDIYGLDGNLVFPARTGFDLASGLGSPRLTGPGGTAGLADYLCSLATRPDRPVVSGLSPDTGSVVGGEHVRIAGRGFEDAGHPVVAGIDVGGDRLSPAAFHVVSATSIVATVPPARDTLPPSAPAPQDGAGPADIVVTVSDGLSSATTPASRFEYVDGAPGGPVPSVTGISPTGGPDTAPAPVTILGSGFTGATRVTFGGVPARSDRVLGPNEISATPPAYSPATRCVRLPATGVYAGETATNDICQVHVRVGNAGGTSAAGPILAPLQGAIATDALGDLELPAGCGCEGVPAPAEYDYLPAPAITSISTTHGPTSLAGENGGTVITVSGRGLDPLGMEWADFGPAGQAFSQDVDFVFLSGTEMQVVAPSEPLTVGPLTVPFSVRTLGGQSPAVASRFAGVPVVSAVLDLSNPTQLHGISGAPDTGGTPIEVDGQGFAGQLVAPIEFVDSSGSGLSTGSEYDDTVLTDSELTTETVAQNPALVDVEACTVTACSATSATDRLYLYPPGDPVVTSVSPGSGPASGATSTLVGGQNLGCPLHVSFGANGAESFASVPTGLDCGSTEKLHATTPPGVAGTTVPVTVTTVESYFTGAGAGTSTANFTYTAGAG